MDYFPTIAKSDIRDDCNPRLHALAKPVAMGGMWQSQAGDHWVRSCFSVSLKMSWVIVWDAVGGLSGWCLTPV